MIKKLTITLITLFIGLAVSAQTSVNLHINQGLPVGNLSEGLPSTVAMFEGSKVTNRTVTYALVQGSFNESGYTYAQFFHEIAISSKPLSVHMEFRTYNFDYNVAYLGLAYSFFTKNGVIAIEPLYRNDSLNLFCNRGWNWKNSSFQMSIVTGHDWKVCNLNTFTDLYTGNTNGSKGGWYSEAWLYFPVRKGFQIGTILQLSAEIGSNFNYAIYPGIKVLF